MGIELELCLYATNKDNCPGRQSGVVSPFHPRQLLSVSLGGCLILLTEELCQWSFCLNIPQKPMGQKEAKREFVSLAATTLPTFARLTAPQTKLQSQEHF